MKLLHKSEKLIILLLLSVAVAFSSCSIGGEYGSDFFAMDTVMTINAYGENSETAVKSAEKEILSLDSLLSVTNESSEVYKLNKDKSLALSETAVELISRGQEILSLTNGAFDITTEPLSRAWGFYSNLTNRIPSKKELNRALKGIGSEHISINENTVTLSENTFIDLGGIAKGYASKTAADILKENGIESALISLGGNVRTVGKKPDGTLWNVGIADPDDNSREIGVVTVYDKAVITSGGYQRYFEKDGKKYHHIINPKTGYPAESGLKSVTVISNDDTLADGLSTALFVMGLDKAKELYQNSNKLFDCVLITDDNRIYITDNIKNSFSSERDFEIL